MQRKRGNYFFAFFTMAVLLLPSQAAAELTDTGNQAQEKRFSEMERQLFVASEGEPQKSYPKRLETAVAAEEKGMGHTVDTYFRYMPERNARRQDGKVEIVDSAFEYDYEFKAFGKLPIELSFTQDYISIGNTTSVRLPSHLVGVSVGIETTLPFFNIDKTYLRFAINPASYGDTWDFRSSAFRMPMQLFGIYQPNDKLTLIAGVAAYIDYEDEVFPIFGFIYKPNDKWTFNIVPKRPYISYALNKKVTLFGEGDISYSEFEVDKSADIKNVILQYREAHTGAGVKYELNKYIDLSVSAGGMFSRLLRYRDRSLGKVAIKPGFYSEFRIEASL